MFVQSRNGVNSRSNFITNCDDDAAKSCNTKVGSSEKGASAPHAVISSMAGCAMYLAARIVSLAWRSEQAWFWITINRQLIRRVLTSSNPN